MQDLGNSLATRAFVDQSTTDPQTQALPHSKERVLARGTAIDRYMILQRLGAGGMGVVYAAYDPMLDRRIAIKLLRVDYDTEDARLRLLREAQAMAQLSHPNVLPIYDVGTWDDEIYLATELIEGDTLRAWLHSNQRSWREILTVFRDAGRGLVAAHQRGLIHRDFKPSNVMVDAEGRVRVMDFGLARKLADKELVESSPPSFHPVDVSGEHTPGSFLASELTSAGTAIGTPAYMAPEQVGGRNVDERADQFSFCVALYEALYRERPFPETRDPNVEYVVDPPKSDVPARVRKAIARGLSHNPEARWPSMNALLGVIERTLSRSRVTLFIAASAMVSATVAGLAYGKLTTPAVSICGGAADEIARVWHTQRADVRGAIMDTGVPYAQLAWTRVEPILDAYASTWSSMHRSTCEATQRHEQSEALMDLRMGCLDQRLWELDAVIRTLSKADAQIVQNASKAVASLASIEACADARLLLEKTRPPSSSQLARVAAVRRMIADAKARELLGKYSEATEIAVEALARAETLGYAPVVAEASFQLGVVEGLSGVVEGSSEHLKRAAWIAEGNHMDELTTRARIALIAVYGLNAGSKDDVDLWAAHARAGIERLGGNLSLELDLSNSIGISWMTLGKYTDALAQFDVSMTTITRMLAQYEPGTAEHAQALRMRGATHNNIGGTHHYLGHLDLARKHYGLAAEQLAATYGSYHPYWAMTTGNLGMMLQSLGDDEGSARALEQSKRAFADSVGVTHPHYAATLVKLAELELKRGEAEHGQALFQQAIDIYDAKFSGPHPLTFQAIEGLGRALQQRHDDAGARLAFERSRTMAEEVGGKDHPGIAAALYGLATLDLRAQRLVDARTKAEQALALLERGVGMEHPSLAEPLTLLARIAMREGQLANASTAIARARALRDRQQGRPEDTAAIDATAGQIEWELGNLEAASTRLAAATAGYRRAGAAGVEPLRELESWKQARALP